MALVLRARTALAVSAALLAATAAAAAPAHAQSAPTTGSTGTVFELPDLSAVLSIKASVDDATASTTVAYVGGKPVVTAKLGTVTVTDKRLLSLALPWSYNASLPGAVEPVVSKTQRVGRDGKKPSKSGAEFRVAEPAVGTGASSFKSQTEFVRVDGDGMAAGLVERQGMVVSTTTTFKPEMRLVLPEDTEAGAYEVVVTHSLS